MAKSGLGRGWVLAAIGAAAVGLGTAWLLAQSPRGLSQFDRLGAEIGCQCGTCPLRPIATCGCGFADGMLEELAVVVDEGHDDEAIMTTFVSRYNESVRIKPSASGLDLTVWAAPMLLLMVGAVALAGVVTRWTRSAAEQSPDTKPAATTPEADVIDSEQARLRALVERELEELDN